MRILKFRKNTGCIIQVVVFDNGLTVSSWQTDIPEIAVYQNLNQFLRVRTKERGYEKIFDKEINVNKMLETSTADDIYAHYDWLSHEAQLQEGSYRKGYVQNRRKELVKFKDKKFVALEHLEK